MCCCIGVGVIHFGYFVIYPEENIYERRILAKWINYVEGRVQSSVRFRSFNSEQEEQESSLDNFDFNYLQHDVLVIFLKDRK